MDAETKGAMAALFIVVVFFGLVATAVHFLQ
jgi:hypothetical protein